MITLKAPAKVNLALKILGLRPDGYHNVRTVMQAVNIFDTVTVKPSKSGNIKLKCFWAEKNIAEPPVEKNLAYRAALLLKHYFDEKKGAKIILKKRIPAGAGLGGGSSDAAAVLKGLCKLWKRKVPAAILNVLASKLGADVAFFLTGGCCLAEGTGEKITPLKTGWRKKPLWLVIVKPKFSTSTKGIYERLDDMRKSGQSTIHSGDSPLNIIPKIKYGKVLKLENIDFVNDLEPAVAKIHPEIERIKRRLASLGANPAIMSGSGSAVFGIFSDKQTASRAARAFKITAFLAHTI